MIKETCPLEKLQFLLTKEKFEDLSNEDVTEIIYLSFEYLKKYSISKDLILVNKALSIATDQVGTRLGLATQEGFISDYFQMWTEFSTQKEAFDYVNNQYEKIFGEKKFPDYLAFCKATKDLPFRYNQVKMSLERV